MFRFKRKVIKTQELKDKIAKLMQDPLFDFDNFIKHYDLKEEEIEELEEYYTRLYLGGLEYKKYVIKKIVGDKNV